MKKSVFLISIILNVSLVSAQTISILGKEFSLITILPGILAAILVLFFIILFIKDSIGSYLKGKTEVKEIKTSDVKIKEKKPEFSKEEKIKDLLTRLKSLNINNVDPKKSLSDLDSLAKDFFRERYSIPQEYSLSELESLVTISKEEAEISKEISTLKYSGQQVKSIEIGAINSKLYKLIRESCKKDNQIKTHLWNLKIPKIGINKEKTIKILKSISLHKLSLNKIHLPRISLAKICLPKLSFPKVFHPNISLPRFSLNSMLKRRIVIREIERGIDFSKTDMHEAKKIYGKALINYYHLPIEEEEKLTRKLAELYERIEIPQEAEKKIKRLVELKKKSEVSNEQNVLVSRVSQGVRGLETKSQSLYGKLTSKLSGLYERAEEFPKDIKQKIKAIESIEKEKISKESKVLLAYIHQWENKLEEESRKREIKERIEKSEYPVQVEIKTKPKSIEYQIKEITAHAPVMMLKKVDTIESDEAKRLLEEKKRIEKEVVNIGGLRSKYGESANEEYIVKEIKDTTMPGIVDNSREVKNLLETEKKIEKWYHKPKREEVVNIEDLRSRYRKLANEEYITREVKSHAPIENIDNSESKEIKKFLEEETKIEKGLYALKRKEVVNVENLRSRYKTLAEKESRYRPLSEKVERKIDIIASRYSSKSQI